MTAGRTNHTMFAAAPGMVRNRIDMRTTAVMNLTAVANGAPFVTHNDPCPSCDGDAYDEAAGECAECGYVLPEPDA